MRRHPVGPGMKAHTSCHINKNKGMVRMDQTGPGMKSLRQHQEKEKEKIIHYNHSTQWIMLDMVRYDQVID